MLYFCNFISIPNQMVSKIYNRKVYKCVGLINILVVQKMKKKKISKRLENISTLKFTLILCGIFFLIILLVSFFSGSYWSSIRCQVSSVENEYVCKQDCFNFCAKHLENLRSWNFNDIGHCTCCCKEMN